MTRYFLHIDSGPDRLADEQGSDLGDDRLALGQAALTAGELLRDGLAEPPLAALVRVTVEDEHRRTIGTVEARLSLGP